MNISNITFNSINDLIHDENVLKVLNCDITDLAASILSKSVNIILLENSLAKASLKASQSNSIETNLTSKAEEIITAEPVINYQYSEALAYVIFILFWYSMSVIALIFTSTKKSALQYFEESNDSPARRLFNNSKNENIKQQELGK